MRDALRSVQAGAAVAGARAHVRATLGHRAGRRQLAPHADVCAGERAGGAAPHLRVVTLEGIWPEVASASGQGWYLSTCLISCFGHVAGFACLTAAGWVATRTSRCLHEAQEHSDASHHTH